MMNYNKLWKLLIDKNMLKKDLREKAGLSTNVIAKMGKGGDVSTQVLRKICEVLDCQIEDIVELDPRKYLLYCKLSKKDERASGRRAWCFSFALPTDDFFPKGSWKEA